MFEAHLGDLQLILFLRQAKTEYERAKQSLSLITAANLTFQQFNAELEI